MIITICIMTYKRPDSLHHLLEAIKGLEFKHLQRPQMHIIVVDNDSAQSARLMCSKFIHSTISMTYLSEPKQGIPIASNCALENIPAETDFIALLDDDEWPSPTWLEELLSTQQRTQATCVLGPVIPIYPDDTPAWIKDGKFFVRRSYPDGTHIGYAASNNVLIDANFIRKTGLRFDETLRFNGGSDTLFFKQAIQRGLVIVWSERASVFEDVPHSRHSLRWLLRRRYRYGNTLAICDRICAPEKMTQPVRIIKGSGRCVLGAVQALAGIVRGRTTFINGLLNIAKGLGMLVGVIGIRVVEYTPSQVDSDRPVKTETQ